MTKPKNVSHRRLDAVEEVLETHGARRPHAVLDTDVIPSERRRVTTRTGSTVEELVPPSDAADPALVAVILPAVDVIEEAAAETNIRPKGHAAFGA